MVHEYDTHTPMDRYAHLSLEMFYLSHVDSPPLEHSSWGNLMFWDLLRCLGRHAITPTLPHSKVSSVILGMQKQD